MEYLSLVVNYKGVHFFDSMRAKTSQSGLYRGPQIISLESNET